MLAAAAVADADGSRSGAAGDGIERAGGCDGGAPRPATSSILTPRPSFFRDLPEMVSATLAVECWAASVVSGEVSGESSFASIVKRLEGTTEGGRAWFSWPQGWEGSGLAEWACELLLWRRIRNAHGAPGWTARASGGVRSG